MSYCSVGHSPGGVIWEFLETLQQMIHARMNLTSCVLISMMGGQTRERREAEKKKPKR
jgi:hypothetical protein